MFKINISECEEENIEKYNTFCDFFTRKLKKGIHVVDKNNKSVVSSCDGRILQFGKIEDKSILQVKGIKTSIQSLLCNDKELSSIYSKGSFLTIYLSPKDYHRIHMPCDGTLKSMKYIPGNLFSVNQNTVNSIDRVFSRNERLISYFETDFGEIAIIMVGAIFVGSMQTLWEGQITPPYTKSVKTFEYKDRQIKLSKGDELGRFNMGSTVILLLPCDSPSLNIELGEYLKMGQSVT